MTQPAGIERAGAMAIGEHVMAPVQGRLHRALDPISSDGQDQSDAKARGVREMSGFPGQPDDLCWDPFDESLKDDPHPVWRRLRDEAPVYYNDQYDFWALSRFEDIDRAHRDPQRYSSAHTTVLESMTEEAQTEGMMIFLDPPEHTALRRLVSKAFTPRRVAELEDEIRILCAGLLDAQQGQNSFDYVQDFGARLPATVIAMLLGVPPSDREDVRHHIDGLFHLEPGVGMANDVSMRRRVGSSTTSDN